MKGRCICTVCRQTSDARCISATFRRRFSAVFLQPSLFLRKTPIFSSASRPVLAAAHCSTGDFRQGTTTRTKSVDESSGESVTYRQKPELNHSYSRSRTVGPRPLLSLRRSSATSRPSERDDLDGRVVSRRTLLVLQAARQRPVHTLGLFEGSLGVVHGTAAVISRHTQYVRCPRC
jgi:hypothetical protein